MLNKAALVPFNKYQRMYRKPERAIVIKAEDDLAI